MPTPKPKRKTKGKRHHVHAVSFGKIADAIDELAVVTPYSLSRIFRDERKRIEGILR